MNIDVYLKKTKLSQKEFGKRVGVSQGLVWQWINGMCEPNPQTAVKIEEITNAEVSRYEASPALAKFVGKKVA